MPDQIRYDEAAINEIFRQAAEAQKDAQERTGPANGLTLDELQEIGAAAGLSPEFVARAAANMAVEIEEPALPTFLGLEIGVRRSVALPGPMSDEDWVSLVADLRQTFHARGKIQEAGELREWYNGNLFAHVQPDGGGYRLSMGSTKASARDLMMTGMGLVVGSVFAVAMLTLFSTGAWRGIFPFLMMMAGGLFMGSYGYLQLPGWRRRREAQMEAVGRRAVERAEKTALQKGEEQSAATGESPVSETAVHSTGNRLDLEEAGGFEADGSRANSRPGRSSTG